MTTSSLSPLSLSQLPARAMVQPMDIDFAQVSANIRYKLLTSLVVPRPIAWVTTISENGTINAAPFSFFNVLGNSPPVVAIGAGDRPDGAMKDTPRNIERTREFIVNLVDEAVAEKMHQSAAPFPAGVSETEALGIQTEPSTTLLTPRIKDCKVHLECTLFDTVQVLDNRIILGLIQHVHVQDGLIDPDTYHIEPGAFVGVGRLQGPGWYTKSQDFLDLGRYPSVKKE